MRAGDLDQRVTIEAPSRATNALGETGLDPWRTVCQLWAQVVAKAAREAQQQAQARHETTYLVRLRWTAELTPERRIRWGKKILAVQSIVANRRAGEILATCVEQANP